MARIEGVLAREAGRRAKLACFFSRHSTRPAEREIWLMNECILGLLQMYVHNRGFASQYRRVPACHLDERLKHLAELKAAALTHCEYCIDIQ